MLSTYNPRIHPLSPLAVSHPSMTTLLFQSLFTFLLFLTMYPVNQLQQDPYVPGPFDNCWTLGEQQVLEQDDAAHAQYYINPRAPSPPPSTPVPEPPAARAPRNPAALCRKALGVLQSQRGIASRPQVSRALYMAFSRSLLGHGSMDFFLSFDTLGYNHSESSMRAFNDGTYGTFPDVYIPETPPTYSRSTLETLDPFGSDPTIALSEIPESWIQRLRNWLVRALAAIGRIRIVTGPNGLQVVRLVDEVEAEIPIPPGLLLVAAERVAADQDANRIAAELAAERLATKQRLAAQRAEQAAADAATAREAAEGLAAELAGEQQPAIAASHVPSAATTSVSTTFSAVHSQVNAFHEFTLAQTRLLDQLRRHGEVVEAERLGLPKPPRRERGPDPFAVRASNTRADDCYCGHRACICYHAKVPGPVKPVAKRAKAPLVLTPGRGYVVQPRFATGQHTTIGFNHPSVTSGLNTLASQDNGQIAGPSRIRMETQPRYQQDASQVADPSRVTLDMLAQQQSTQAVGPSNIRLPGLRVQLSAKQLRLGNEAVLGFCPNLDVESDDDADDDAKQSAGKGKGKSADKKQ